MINKNFLFFFKRYYKHGAAVFWINIIIACVLSPAGSVIGLWMKKQTINSITNNADFVEILILIVIFVSVQSVISVVLYSIQELFINIKSIKISHCLTRDIYEDCLKFDYVNFDDPEFYNSYAWTIKEYKQKCKDSMALVISLIGSLFGVSVIVTVFFSLDWILMLLAVLNLMCNTFLGLAMNKTKFSMKDEGILHNRKLNYINRIFYQEGLLADLKINGASNKVLSFFDDSCREIVDIHIKHSKRLSALSSLSKCCTFLFAGGMYLYLSYRALTFQIQVGDFVVLISAVNMVKSYLASIFDFFKIAKDYELYSQRIFAFFNSSKRIEDESNYNKIHISDTDKPYSVCIKNLRFNYGDTNKFSLEGIDLRIESGEKIAIVGSNGSGKTTLVKLLLRLYDPVSGSIEVNGIDLKKIDLKTYRQNVGVSMQDAPVLAFSVYDNLSIYKNNDIDKAIKVSGFEKVLDRKNANIDSLVSKEFDSEGIALSGGEKRLLSLARVLGGEFGMVVLDEPASALDPITEARIMDEIFSDKFKNTVILISHRLVNVMKADKIIVFSNGKIVEMGTHDALMKNNGLYCEMFLKQSGQSVGLK